MTSRQKSASRKDHGPAILRFLRAKGPRSLAQIIAHLRLDNDPDAADYDLRKLRAARVIVSRARKWEVV